MEPADELRLGFEMWLANHKDLSEILVGVRGSFTDPTDRQALDMLVALVWSRTMTATLQEQTDWWKRYMPGVAAPWERRRDPARSLWLQPSMRPTWRTRVREWFRRVVR